MGKMDRRVFLGAVSGSAAALLARPLGGIAAVSERDRSASRKSRGARRPNILFVFTDDQRFDTIHALGNADIRTPVMDELVARGVSFTHACIMGSTVPAVCAPSRAMLMSGRTLYRVPLDLEGRITFPELLRAHGYTTFSTGKWHNQPPSFARSFDAGGKIFFGGMSNHLQVPVQDFDPSGRYPKERQYVGEKFSSEMFSDQAISFLRGYSDASPFCMYVSYTAPHDPRMPPQRYKEMYDPARIPLPGNFLEEHPFDNGELRIRDEMLAPFPRPPEEIQRHLAEYYGMISHLDEHLGRLLETLDETGQAGNTVIIFAGDNGLAVGQHGLMGKQNLYEHSIRVPLIIAGPGVPEGERCGSLCYLLDLFPTVCELTGVKAPDDLEGHSLVPLLMGEADRLRDNLFFAYRDCQRAVRDERYKLVEYFVQGSHTTQLFDIVEDPLELNNLAEDAKLQGEVGRLREELGRWQRELADPLLDE